MAENPESQPTKQPARSSSKQHQEAVLLQLRELKHAIGEQQQAQEKLRSELTEQAKGQQEQTEHRIQEIEKTLAQHQQEMKQLLQAMTAAYAQQQAQVNLPPQKKSWTGFADKTLWDWLQLLGILVIAGATLLFSIQQARLADLQHQSDQKIATDQLQESILDTYQKDIAGLILSQPLDTSPQGIRGRLAARAYTIETIFRLDSPHKGRLIQFLYGAHLLQTEQPVVDLSQADLSQASLSGLDLHSINLSRAILRGADLRNTNLSRADLQGVDLKGAKLDKTNLTGAYLWQADLEGLDLRLTNLQGADLKDSKVQGTKPKIPPPLSSTCINSGSDLGDDTSKWNTFLPGDKKAQVLSKVTEPSFDGNALQVSNPGGDPNTNVGASYTWPQNYTAPTLHLSLCFYLTDLNPVQALTFSVNRRMNNQRYEISLQYEAVGDGSLQQGTPPTWRIWSGQDWRLTQIKQKPLIEEGKWYWLDLQGEIVKGQLHYIRFVLNGTPYPLNKYANPVPLQTKDGLDLGVQLAGDAQGDPYSIYLDDVNLKS